MFVLAVEYKVKPGQTDIVIGHLTRMAEQVRAHEPGCALYHVARSREAEDTLMLIEHYVDEAAFDAHLETDHFKAIIVAEVIPLLENRQRELYDLVVG